MHTRILAAAVAAAAIALLSGVALADSGRRLNLGMIANTQGWGNSMGAEQDRVAQTGARSCGR